MFLWILGLDSEDDMFTSQLSCENLWQIELCRPPGQTAKYLTIQVSCYSSSTYWLFFHYNWESLVSFSALDFS